MNQADVACRAYSEPFRTDRALELDDHINDDDHRGKDREALEVGIVSGVVRGQDVNPSAVQDETSQQLSGVLARDPAEIGHFPDV